LPTVVETKRAETVGRVEVAGGIFQQRTDARGCVFDSVVLLKSA